MQQPRDVGRRQSGRRHGHEGVESGGQDHVHAVGEARGLVQSVLEGDGVREVGVGGQGIGGLLPRAQDTPAAPSRGVGDAHPEDAAEDRDPQLLGPGDAEGVLARKSHGVRLPRVQGAALVGGQDVDHQGLGGGRGEEDGEEEGEGQGPLGTSPAQVHPHVLLSPGRGVLDLQPAEHDELQRQGHHRDDEQKQDAVEGDVEGLDAEPAPQEEVGGEADDDPQLNAQEHGLQRADSAEGLLVTPVPSFRHPGSPRREWPPPGTSGRRPDTQEPCFLRV